MTPGGKLASKTGKASRTPGGNPLTPAGKPAPKPGKAACNAVPKSDAELAPPAKPVHWTVSDKRNGQTLGQTLNVYQTAFYARREAERSYPEVPLSAFAFAPIANP